MSFSINTDAIKETMRKLRKNDLALFTAARKKIDQIAALDETAVHHFKNLKGHLSNHKRVHIGSFVLMFRVEGNTLIFVKLVHHDEAY